MIQLCNNYVVANITHPITHLQLRLHSWWLHPSSSTFLPFPCCLSFLSPSCLWTVQYPWVLWFHVPNPLKPGNKVMIHQKLMMYSHVLLISTYVFAVKCYFEYCYKILHTWLGQAENVKVICVLCVWATLPLVLTMCAVLHDPIDLQLMHLAGRHIFIDSLSFPICWHVNNMWDVRINNFCWEVKNTWDVNNFCQDVNNKWDVNNFCREVNNTWVQ